jgi:replicative DNA helicase
MDRSGEHWPRPDRVGGRLSPAPRDGFDAAERAPWEEAPSLNGVHDWRESMDARIRDLEHAEELERQRRHVVRDGATFILDENAELEARWGRGSEVLWARGESLLLAAPPGVGKTTIAAQVTGALIGVLPDVLGYPVTPAARVLYAAMDRPRQIRRAMRRLFGEEHRQALADRLLVRAGPISADLGKSPEALLDLACAHSCDVVILDSLKDAAVKLTDDEIGGNVNRAIQACNAADVDVLALHHQRKGVGGDKPTKLEDVYGSTWLTAGAGSVLLLWGEPGAEIVELSHLKQPADPLGPWTIEHDHHRGTSRITRGFDALAYLRLCGTSGATIADAAQAEHGSPQKTGGSAWKRTERRMRALVRDGHATTTGRARVGEPARYYPMEALIAMDTPHGQGVLE